ncbi:23S rRNA (uracil1939-C5)-methyltransferase [Rhodobium orientis]|uniref:RNA methyltransferase n=1 Tax=Rhodobium orientis TaxID=34017 RepID=A0A327JS14_9HYPH|nr:class I SAM-dependent RNA methyltransferase [Rhodobium orientis]MBB4303909.1 23S rRNA (uracil1939-C5)-methyltransferase [Rhodobium orientis]MBK5951454.1 RNA methyltransferase [Rhodobium orientis]RAI26158.1 RNA methyltransferase [Rhodobium orientis]
MSLADRIETLTIDQLGHRGDGVATLDGAPVYVPYALAGETVRARIEDDRAELLEVVEPSANRREPACRHFGTCGGCALQHLAPEPYLSFKRDLVVEALKARGLQAPIAATAPIAPETRRRAVLSAVRTANAVVLGYHAVKSHQVVPISECPVLVPEIVAALPRLQRLAAIAAPRRGTLRMTVLAADNGLDIHLAETAKLSDDLRQQLVRHTVDADHARLSIGDETILQTRPPVLDMAGTKALPVPGGFTQASAAAEASLFAAIAPALARTKRVTELFSGVGTFTFRLARSHAVDAFEGDAAAVEALRTAARHGSGIKPIAAERRDLFRRPLMAKELKKTEAVVFDPPRAGAKDQAAALASSKVPTVIAVSCNPATLARDLKLLVDGGYRLTSVQPVDQFLWSPHIEVVATLTKG